MRGRRLLLLVALCTLGVAGDDASPRRAFQKGFTLGGWTSHDYARPEVDAQLDALRSGGVEWVALTPRWFQAERSSLGIRPDPARSPTDESVRAVARLARSKGMRVFLKPQIDVTGPGWRGEISFRSEADWQRWFASYERFILHHAALASEVGASLFSVGVELDATRHRAEDWRRVIARVREVYAGPLVYAANWNRERDITWWGDLDYAGVDAYFPVAGWGELSVADARERWATWLRALRAWAERIDKPVIFTEIGYRSLAGAGEEPWEWEREGVASPREQAILYEAALSALWQEPWLEGLYWWQWRTAPPAVLETDTGFTPQGKPAWDVLRDYYARDPGP